jgi:hypothetical protein
MRVGSHAVCGRKAFTHGATWLARRELAAALCIICVFGTVVAAVTDPAVGPFVGEDGEL